MQASHSSSVMGLGGKLRVGHESPYLSWGTASRGGPVSGPYRAMSASLTARSIVGRCRLVISHLILRGRTTDSEPVGDRHRAAPLGSSR